MVSKTRDGTKIDQKPYSKNWKAVRESLGILFSNNFLIAEKTLLVEGPSDVIYFLAAVKRLKTKGLIDIDLNDMSIVDAGDAQNYVAMTKVMLSEGREIVALLDGDTQGKKVDIQLKRICAAEIKSKKLRIHLLPEGKSSENLFASLDGLRAAIRSAYDQLVTEKLRAPLNGVDVTAQIDKIAPAEGTTLGRIIEQITEGLFDPKEPISKLLIAILYEDNASGEELPESALEEVSEIKGLLNLRGEKSKAQGVFEEAEW